jgi:hypothetical protein
MKQLTKQNLLTVASLLLALPTAYFLLINILKFELGVDEPYDSSWPLFESVGIRESLGWNINLLILLGPVVAFVLTIFQAVKINWHISKEHFLFQFTVRKRWFPLLVAAFSVSLLTVLFLYLFAENCLSK